MAMDKRTRASRDYGRAIDWLAAHAPALAAPVGDYVSLLRDECARLRIENGALRAAAGEPDAIDPTPEWRRDPAPEPWVARAAELLAEQDRPRPRPTTWLPRPDPRPATDAHTPGIGR